MIIEMNAGDLNDVIEAAQATMNDEIIINLYEDKWIMRCGDPGGNFMAAAVVPEEAMTRYEPGTAERLGIKLAQLDNFIRGTTDDILIKYEDHDLIYKQGTAEVHTKGIEPQYVEGEVDKTPKLEYGCTFTADIDWIFRFLKQTKSVVGSDHFMIGLREDELYVYTYKDDTSMVEHENVDSFEDFNVDWDNFHMPDEGDVSDIDRISVPSEEHATDTMLSMDYAENFNKVSSEATVYLDHHAPFKIVFEKDSGTKVSYILAPRIPTSDGKHKIPAAEVE